MTGNNAASPQEASTAELIERLNTQVTRLIRTELDSAVAEMKSKGTRIGLGVGVSGVGALVLVFGLGALVAAAVLGLATAVSAWLSALIIGAILAVSGVVLAGVGALRARTAAPPMPDRTAASVREDVTTVKENL